MLGFGLIALAILVLSGRSVSASTRPTVRRLPARDDEDERNIQSLVNAVGAKWGDPKLRVKLDGVIGPSTVAAVNRALTLYAPAGPVELFTGKITARDIENRKVDIINALHNALQVKRPGMSGSPETKAEKIRRSVSLLGRDELLDKADAAEERGAPLTAEALRDRARLVGNTPDPPFPVDRLAWKKLLVILAPAQRDTITRGGSLGYFLISPKRLEDIGAMRNVQKTDGQWTGEWVEPWTSDRFLSGFEAQYELFAASVRRYLNLARSLVNKDFSLSAAIAAVHVAGPAGAKKWFSSPEDREKYASTTEVVNRANGLF